MTPAQQLNEQFEDIYRTHHARLAGVVRREVRHGDLRIADDLTADAFMQAWLNLHKCRATSDAQVFAWLATIARRTVGQHYRAKKNTCEVPADTGHWSYANKAMETGPAGCYTPAATGFRTVQIGGTR